MRKYALCFFSTFLPNAQPELSLPPFGLLLLLLLLLLGLAAFLPLPHPSGKLVHVVTELTSLCEHVPPGDGVLPAASLALGVGQAVVPGDQPSHVDALFLAGVEVLHAVGAAVQTALLGVEDLLLSALVGLCGRVVDVEPDHGHVFPQVVQRVKRQGRDGGEEVSVRGGLDKGLCECDAGEDGQGSLSYT